MAASGKDARMQAFRYYEYMQRSETVKFCSGLLGALFLEQSQPSGRQHYYTISVEVQRYGFRYWAKCGLSITTVNDGAITEITKKIYSKQTDESHGKIMYYFNTYLLTYLTWHPISLFFTS